MTRLKRIVAVLFVLALIAAVVSCEVAIWRDCRVNNGWLTCLRVMSK